MTNEEKLHQYIREMVKKELEERTTTGNIAGYNVPMAFQGNNPKNKARKKGIATQLGMQLTPRGQKDLDRPADKLEHLEEGKMRYHEYKKDESASPTKKIARAISEVNKNIQEMERVLKMNSRLQKESGIASEALYRRTQEGLIKLEARLLHLAGKVRDIRGK
jgi:hypothetical protein